MYQIEFSRSADKEIDRLSAHIAGRVMGCITSLADNPRPAGVKKMRGFRSVYRICVGSCRVIYEIRDSVLIVLIRPLSKPPSRQNTSLSGYKSQVGRRRSNSYTSSQFDFFARRYWHFAFEGRFGKRSILEKGHRKDVYGGY
ncbi:type II toxin-antitoxin system RelE/ParE family toxin [Candidatus Saccharibacteria bacterium]|nr:type II toxin-antitoxin system RelE/ParE family toxin [Candidatus Saccharibacteria bacterium]